MDACFQLKRYKKQGENRELKPYSLNMEEWVYKSPEVVLPYEVSSTTEKQKKDEEEVIYIALFSTVTHTRSI